MIPSKYVSNIAAFSLIVLLGGLCTRSIAQDATVKPKFRGLLGKDSKKVKHEGGKTYLWAGGDRSGKDAQWYDFTDSPIPTSQLQFGIGKDRIRAIDDPLFVKADDPRLMKLPKSYYRQAEKVDGYEDIMVIGYAEGTEAKAYPTALLDHHELVNVEMHGKPLTVGW